MVVKFRSNQLNLLHAYFKAFSAYVDEINLEVSPNGLVFRQLDPSRVSMFDVILPKEIFIEFECDKEKILCFNGSPLLKVFKLAVESDVVEFEESENAQHLLVTLIGEAKQTFKLPILEEREDKVPPPNVSFTAKATIKTALFNRLLANAQNVSDHMKLLLTNEGLTMQVIGDIVDAKLFVASQELSSPQVTKETKSTYSLSYMTEVTKCLSESCDAVTLQWTTDFPILVEFHLRHAGQMRFFLAPRIETD